MSYRAAHLRSFHRLFSAFLLLFVALWIARASAADFSANFGGTTLHTNFFQNGAAFDAAGNVYIIGTFTDTALAMGNAAVTKIGAQDTAVAKIDASGNTVWLKNFGGPSATIEGQGITVDASGNVYAVGYFDTGNMTTPALTKIGVRDAFIVKLDSAGNNVWAQNYGSNLASNSTRAQGVTTDAAGNVYVTGYFNRNLNNPVLVKTGSQDGFVFKLDGAGNFVWTKNVGSASALVYFRDIAVDTSGNVYLAAISEGAGLVTPAMTKIGSRDAFAVKLDSAGNSVWATNIGGTSASTEGQSIAVDTSGNVYLNGFFSQGNLTTPALPKIGSTDTFVMKIDSVGTRVWAKNFGGAGVSGSALGANVAADASGNVYVSSRFGGANLTSPALTIIGTADTYVVKLDSAGNNVWGKNFGGVGNPKPVRIALDVSGNVLVGGSFNGGDLTTPLLAGFGATNAFAFKLDSAGNTTSAKGVPYLKRGGFTDVLATAIDAAGNTYITGTTTGITITLGGITLARLGNRDAFVAKVNAAGVVQWAKNFGGSGASIYARKIAVDASGNIYVAGYFTNANLTTPALTRIGTDDAFAFKLDNLGNSVWAKNFGGIGASAGASDIKVDASGNVYLSGGFGNADITTPALARIGTADAFAFKLDSAGDSVWSKNFGGSGALAAGASITVDASGNVYLGGRFNTGNLTTPALTKIGSQDPFAFKLDSSGNSVWSKNFGGSGAVAAGESITVDAAGNVYLAGVFEVADLTTPALTKIGVADAFALKLDSAGNSLWSKNFGGVGANAFAEAIALDASGNVYLGGSFNTASLTTPALTRIGTQDAFAFKLDSAGNNVLSKNFGGIGAVIYIPSIAVDAFSNIYLGGYFDSANLTTPALTKFGGMDGLIIKSYFSNFALTAIKSRKPDGGTDRDITIDTALIAPAVTMEPRAIGGGHTLVFQFNSPVTSSGTVTVSPVGSGTATFLNNDVFVKLVGVPDNQRVTVTLTDVNGGLSPPPVKIGFLVGDVNGSRAVNAADISALKARDGIAANGANFMFDLNVSGTIDSADIVLVKVRSGATLP